MIVILSMDLLQEFFPPLATAYRREVPEQFGPLALRVTFSFSLDPSFLQFSTRRFFLVFLSSDWLLDLSVLC